MSSCGALTKSSAMHGGILQVVDSALLHWAPLVVTDVKRDKWSIHSKMGPPDLFAGRA